MGCRAGKPLREGRPAAGAAGWESEDLEEQVEVGEPLEMEHLGPVIRGRRSCTDTACLLLFLAFLAGWAAVAMAAFLQGDVSRVLLPTDSRGRVCGRGELTSRRLLLVFDMTKCLNPAVLVEGCLTPQACVAACPTQTSSPLADATAGLLPQHAVKERVAPYCLDPELARHPDYTVAQLVAEGVCPAWYLASSEVLGRCIPDTGQAGAAVEEGLVEQGKQRFASLLAVRQLGERVASDLQETAWMVGLALAAASLLSFCWVLLLRLVAGLIVYSSMLVLVAALAALLAYCSYTLALLWRSTDPEVHKTVFHLNWTPQIIDEFLKQKDTWLAFTCVLGILLVIIFCLFIFLWKRIRLAVSLIEEGSKAVGAMWPSLGFPLVPFLLQLVVVAWFLVCAFCLASWGEAEHAPAHLGPTTPSCMDACLPSNTSGPGGFCREDTVGEACPACPEVTCRFVRYARNKDYSWMQLVNVFGLLWGTFFCAALGELVLARVFAEWYWSQAHLARPAACSVLAASLATAASYHLGTVAFGSLIIAAIRLVRILLEYVAEKCRKYTNDLTKCLLCCCRCCLYCLEKFMRFVNRNAYIICAVKGTNFCTSAKTAFNLITRNLVRVVVLDSVVDFLLFLGKLIIAVVTGTASYLVFAGQVPDLQDRLPRLNYFFTPVIFIVVGSYVIASSFFSVYSMAVDTLFLCFLEDLERNDGSQARPYCMSSNLRAVLGRMERAARQRGQ